MQLLVDEVDRRDPLETGGVLLGYWGKETDEPGVTAVIGPGSGAVHSQFYFKPDHEYQTGEISRRYFESDRRLQYLGDWHSHPGGGDSLSALDRRCLKMISKCPEARVDEPIMMILSGIPKRKLSAWHFRRTGGLFRRRILFPLEIFDFD